ncbi:MAG: hypothetical protein JSS53_04800 [Proteobacteria bacterium]|nr:hypothetical protein [Pseudomonadota bacterium]
MAQNSLNDLTNLINKAVGSHEVLEQYILKAKSLVQVAQGEGFWDYYESVIKNYLWSTEDLINLAEQSSSEVRNDLVCLQEAIEVKKGDNIFKTLGFNDFEGEELQLRSSMMNVLINYVKKSNLTEELASKKFNVPIEVIKNALAGRIDLVKTEELLPILGKIYLQK